MRLWAKLAATILPLAALTVGAVAVGSHRAVDRVLARQVEERVSSLALGARVPGLVEALEGRGMGRSAVILRALHSAGAVYSDLLTPEGKVIASSRPALVGSRVWDPALSSALSDGGPALRRLPGRGHGLVEATVALRRGDASPRAVEHSPVVGALRVALTFDEALATGELISERISAIVGGAAAAFSGLAFVLLWRALVPLHELRAVADRLEEGGLGTQAPVRSRDEIGRLTEAFNRMSARLAESTVSRDFVESVLEGAPDPMIVADPEGRIVYVNGKVSEVFGYAPAELRGEKVEILVPESLRSRHHGLRGDYMRGPKARPMGAGLDLRARRKDGSEVPVEISLSPANTRQGLRVIATVRDVTEQRKTREALRQSVQALQRSNEALEQFAFIASHDLQEPLRKVSSYCQLLERRYADKLDSDGKDFIRYAVDGAARMRLLITDLLAYSRIGRQETPWETVELSAACGRALEALQPAITEAGALVRVGPLPVVRGRATALAQAFQNVIGNAVKFRSERPLALRIDAERRDKEWVVSVEDNGIGIEQRHRERVFDVFERLHPHSRYPGTGIGLAIVKRVVEQHGGRIWADETPGGGSTFRFTLPVLEDA